MYEYVFLPKKLKVGYQERNDTYSKKLAYVTYYDNKDVLRKEKSWEGWRDSKIAADDFDNEPMAGFVLNKRVGGKGYSLFDTRETYVRVYDPRGFEFEITVNNLLYILEHVDCIKGKGLEGEFIYVWSGQTLLLIPIISPEYANIKKLSDKIFSDFKLNVKKLKIGAAYKTSKNEKFVYLGKHDTVNYDKIYSGSKHVFYNCSSNYFYNTNLVNLASISGQFIEIISESRDSNTDKYLREINKKNYYIDKEKDKGYYYVPYTFEEFNKEFLAGGLNQEYYSPVKRADVKIEKKSEDEVTIPSYNFGKSKTLTVKEFLRKYRPIPGIKI